MFTKLWRDPEVYGRIFLQAQMLSATGVAGAHAGKLYDILHDVMHKLTAMRYHLDGYRFIEQQMYEDHRREVQRDPTSNAECFPLIFMFESFTFQLKSALDMLVKILTVVDLKNKVSTATYGANGDSVIDGLVGNQDRIRKLVAEGTPCEGEQGIARIQALIDLMEKARDTWLREAVDVRDGVSHFKAAKRFVFTPVKTPEGVIDAARPVFERNGKTIEPSAFMKRLYRECTEFSQDFMCRALNIKAPYYELMPADRSRASAVAGPDAHFIKWGWGVKGEAVDGIFDTDSE